MRRIIAPATVVALALLLAACGSGNAAQPSPSSTEPQAASYCGQLVGPGKAVSFKAEQDGTVLRGIEFGTSGTGVVLAHQDQGSVCEWLPFGNKLAAKGYHVLAFDFGGEGDSDKHPSGPSISGDVVSAAKWLRSRGATDLVLMGASKGGTASLAATTKLDPGPKAVVTLSAPTTFDAADALSAVPKVTFPVLYIAGEYDSPFDADAKQLYDATPPAVHRQLLVVPSASEHGTALFAGSAADTVTKAIDDFLAKEAPPATK
jgi:esterase/lipase